MATRSTHNAVMGVLSLFVLVCGIVFSALVGVYFERIHDKQAVNDEILTNNGYTPVAPYYFGPVWAVGFAFIISGFIGALSACGQAKPAYITHMVLGIITLLVMGVILGLVIYIMSSSVIMRPDDNLCTTVGRKCVCDKIGITKYGTTCEYVKTMFDIFITVFVTTAFGWVLTLVTVILGCILACTHEVQPGVRLVQFHGQVTNRQDQSQLVCNMEYEPGIYNE